MRGWKLIVAILVDGLLCLVFCTALNFRTSTKKVMDKFKKLNRNYKPRIISPLEREENTITSPDKIADIFANHYANILRDPNNKSKPGKHRKKTTYHIINYSQTELKTAKEYST